MSVSEQVLSNKILQQGTAAYKINSAGDILNIQFTLRLPNSHKKSEESEEDCHVQKIQPDTVFFLTGKFAMLPNGSLELVVSSCKNLQIEKDKMPICKPIVYLLGKVKESCNTTDLGYYITIEVKPYLSSELCGPKDIVLTHPIEGRLKNTFTAAKKTLYYPMHRRTIHLRRETILRCNRIAVYKYQVRIGVHTNQQPVGNIKQR